MRSPTLQSASRRVSVLRALLLLSFLVLAARAAHLSVAIDLCLHILFDGLYRISRTGVAACCNYDQKRDQ